MGPVRAHAYPRVGLLGNPSDLYGGQVIALPFTGFRAEVTIEPAADIALHGQGAAPATFASWDELQRSLSPRDYPGGIDLLAAAVARLVGTGTLSLEEDDPRARFRMSLSTDIPRQVGLAGSSAIVVAALRALAQWFGLALTPFRLAELALAAETEELGIVAGPQDRVVQAYQQFLHMDFSATRRPEAYTALAEDLLPPLLVAWEPKPGTASGSVHSAVRARWLAGDESVRSVMVEIAELAAQGMGCLRARDIGRVRELVDRNFDLRASVFAITAGDRDMVTLGRAAGAGVKLAGSGGAVVCVVEDPRTLPALEAGYRRAGYHCLQPQLPA